MYEIFIFLNSFMNYINHTLKYLFDKSLFFFHIRITVIDSKTQNNTITTQVEFIQNMSESSYLRSNDLQEYPKHLFDQLESNSNDENVNVDMDNKILTKLEDSLQCPICYKIPRELPIPSCEVGHIICRTCRTKINNCPTCRRCLANNTNSLAGAQIILVNHKCKFSHYGCHVKMKIKEILFHEENCEERTVTCPRYKCKKEVQLKLFKNHALKEGCGISIKYKYFQVGAFCFSYNIKKFCKNIDMKTNQMVTFNFHNEIFYFLISYKSNTNCFVIAIILAEDADTTSKYNVKITVNPHKHRKLAYEGEILSLENLPDMETEIAKSKYWFVAYDAMEPYINSDISNTISIPFEVDVLKLDKKRKRF